MKVFLAGENGKSKIIPIVHGGMFDEVKNENIHSRHSSMWGG